MSRVWLISVCMCAGVVSVVGLISDITSAKVSAVTDKCACVWSIHLRVGLTVTVAEKAILHPTGKGMV